MLNSFDAKGRSNERSLHSSAAHSLYKTQRTSRPSLIASAVEIVSNLGILRNSLAARATEYRRQNTSAIRTMTFAD